MGEIEMKAKISTAGGWVKKIVSVSIENNQTNIICFKTIVDTNHAFAHVIFS